MPFMRPGADWLLLGPDVQLRHTSYDLAECARRVLETSYPQAREFAAQYVQTPSEADVLAQFTSLSFRCVGLHRASAGRVRKAHVTLWSCHRMWSPGACGFTSDYQNSVALAAP